MLEQLQKSFASLIKGKASAEQLKQFSCAAVPIEQASQIYQNNYFLSLIEALELSYPMTERLVGEDYFKACCRAFILEHGMHAPCISEFGGGFADYLRHQAALSEQSYISEVAKFEWALELSTGLAHQEKYLTLDDLQHISVELDQLHLALLPQLQLFSSPNPVVHLYDMIKCEQVEAIEMNQACWVVLEKTRDFDVAMHKVDKALWDFLSHCQKGQSLASLPESQLNHLQQHLLFTLQQGWFSPLMETQS